MNEKNIVKNIEEFILKELSKGALRRATLIERAVAVLKSNSHTVTGTISQMNKSGRIIQIERSIWGLPDSIEPEQTETNIEAKETKGRPDESAFYAPFADWLVDEGECTLAHKFGGKHLSVKWGTPDVIGIEKTTDTDRYRHHQIISFVSSEIKTTIVGNQIIGAFGQACAYLHFSHKVFLVLPNSIKIVDSSRIKSLCKLLGLGLVYFDSANASKDSFNMIIQPILKEPDVVALNRVLNNSEVEKRLINRLS